VQRLRTWILIADGGGARIVEAFEKGAEQPVASGRHKTTAALAGTAATKKCSTEQRGVAKALEALFASQLSSMLSVHHRNNAFDELILIAPASMLHKLRKMITPEVQGKIVVEIEKDLSHVPNEAISSCLNEVAAI
jgi:protein required for attachment to host cells